MNKDVIIACDFNDKEHFFKFINIFENEKPFLKIGYQLFYSEGIELIKQLKEKGYKIFLDLKLHDIPNTVEHGIKSLVKLNVDFITVHAAGGIQMMELAVKATKNTQTKILAVTQLTSTSQKMLEDELLIDRKISDVVNRYAVNALNAGVYGIVCSAQESKYTKEKISNNLITVCPGIRLDKKQTDDQSRVMTPIEAKHNFADYIVVGRPITNSSNPLETYLKIKKDFLG
ncbi:MAG: orotidine-5'-phosphate decarboxylase [Mycoplasmataceae bacterium]|jgi:orotidine-5'-phosphate decarboxylase|nr:orotidine-5'-phosphate decarboxylase [Mycoplasmataceae bacterium]